MNEDHEAAHRCGVRELRCVRNGSKADIRSAVDFAALRPAVAQLSGNAPKIVAAVATSPLFLRGNRIIWALSNR